MNLRQLECIVAIADYRSMKEAAQILQITQPALSKCLLSVERHIDQPLFFRGRHLTLTPAGQIYVNFARQMIEVKRRTYNMILSQNSTQSEHFSMGATPHAGSILFAGIYPDFYHQYPDVRVEYKEGYFMDLLDLLREGKIDICFGVSDSKNSIDPDVKFFPVIQEERMIAIAASHPLATDGAATGEGPCPKVSLSKFRNVPFVGYRVNTFASYLLRKLSENAGFVPITVYETSNSILARNMARALDGITLLPRNICLPEEGMVYFSNEPPCNIINGVYVRKDLELTEALQYFIYLIVRMEISTFLPAQLCLCDEIQTIIEKWGEIGGENRV